MPLKVPDRKPLADITVSNTNKANEKAKCKELPLQIPIQTLNNNYINISTDDENSHPNLQIVKENSKFHLTEKTDSLEKLNQLCSKRYNLRHGVEERCETVKEAQNHLLLIESTNPNTFNNNLKSIDVKPKLPIKLRPSNAEKHGDPSQLDSKLKEDIQQDIKSDRNCESHRPPQNCTDLEGAESSIEKMAQLIQVNPSENKNTEIVKQKKREEEKYEQDIKGLK